MSREQALEFLKCSSPTLIKFQKEGLPYYRLGRKILFKKSEMLEFSKVDLKQSKVKSKKD